MLALLPRLQPLANKDLVIGLSCVICCALRPKKTHRIHWGHNNRERWSNANWSVAFQLEFEAGACTGTKRNSYTPSRHPADTIEPITRIPALSFPNYNRICSSLFGARLRSCSLLGQVLRWGFDVETWRLLKRECSSRFIRLKWIPRAWRLSLFSPNECTVNAYGVLFIIFSPN